MPDYLSYHRSLTEELYSLRNRVRNLVRHWPSDGESKETALRSILRRHLPASVLVGRGFIVTEGDSSTQIDILILDASKPTLFKEGDLYVVTPDVVLGIIEVKTRLASVKSYSKALTKLCEAKALCPPAPGKKGVWTGLFVFEGKTTDDDRILGGLGNAFQETHQIINCVSHGKSLFSRHWSNGSVVFSPENGPVWHSYHLPKIAPSYFLGNLVSSVSTEGEPATSFAWFPALGGKENHRSKYLPVGTLEPIEFG